MIHKEGRIIVIYSLIFSCLLAAILLRLAPTMGSVAIPVLVILNGLIINFFRNPNRKLEEVRAEAVFAPADGKVVVVEKTIEHEYLKRECWQISIFMSPLNVHINWNPVGGKVQYYKYHPGKFLVAWHPKSSTLNERTTSVIHTKAGDEIVVRQIAGAVARRIINYHTKNEFVEQGAELGFIRFGSRVDVFLPLEYEISVHPDEKVRGLETILAKVKA